MARSLGPVADLSDYPRADRPVSVLEPERFPAAAELVLSQYILARELKAGAGVVVLFRESLMEP